MKLTIHAPKDELEMYAKLALKQLKEGNTCGYEPPDKTWDLEDEWPSEKIKT